MPSTDISKKIYRFGLFEANSHTGELLRAQQRVKLQDQPFRLLIVLLEHAGEVVTREQLRQELWAADTYVEFDGSLNATLKRLRAALGDSADNPTFIQTVPKRGYRFLAPVAVEESGPAASEEPTPASSVPKRRAWPGTAALIAILTLLLLAVLALSPRLRSRNKISPPAVAAAPVTPRRSLAVLGFRNSSGHSEDAWLSTALSEMLSTDLSQGDQLRIVSGEDVAHYTATSEVRLDSSERKAASRMGTALDADLLVFGSYVALGSSSTKQIRVDVRLQDAASGNILKEAAATGTENDLFQLASLIGNELRQNLGLPAISLQDRAEAMASLPANPDAARLYAVGVDKLRSFDFLAAKDLLEQALKLDPKFVMGHVMLARAWSQLGYEQKRREECKRALDFSTNISRSERMLVEADYYDSLGKHEKATSTYNALYQLFPDNIEFGLALAASQVAEGHGSQALETVARLRQLPPPASNDARIDLAEARILTNRLRAMELIKRALEKASALDNKWVYARARRDECWALVYGDNPGSGIELCQDAYKLSYSAGNLLGAADSLRLIGDAQGSAGDFGRAVTTYEQALHLLKGLGEHEKTGAILNNMAINYANQGKLSQAEQFYREAKSHFVDAGDQLNTVTTIANLADIAYLSGSLAKARRLYEDALQVESGIDPENPGYMLYRLADLDLTQADIPGAHQNAEKAIESLKSIDGGYEYLTGGKIVLGEILEQEGNLVAAREEFEDCLKIREKAEAHELVAETQVELSELEFLQQHADRAESLLRDAILEFGKEKADPNSGSAYLLLSRILLERSQLQPAQDAWQRAAKFGETSADPALKLPIAIQHARLLIAQANSDNSASALTSARHELQSAAATAHRLGYNRLESEAKLEMGALESKMDPVQGRKQLLLLAQETRARGLELMAQEAERRTSKLVLEARAK